MSTLKYRIEERFTAGGAVISTVDFDDRDKAMTTHDLWAHFVGQNAANFGQPNPYGPDGDRRLVLLGPDRSALPRITEGPAL